MKLLPLPQLLALSLLCLTPLALAAETTPRAGNHDRRVRVAPWVEGQVYRVVTNLTRVTSIEFGAGETITSILAGDTLGFQFDGVPGGRAFAIKPASAGAATNITVYTNQRSYYFHVVEAREAPHYVIQFRYPDQSAKSQSAITAAAPNQNYGASHHTELTPTAVWDDGSFTYFRFAKAAALPAIFRATKGQERSVNATVLADGVIRVSGVSAQWVLRLGEASVCITDLAPAVARP